MRLGCAQQMLRHAIGMQPSCLCTKCPTGARRLSSEREMSAAAQSLNRHARLYGGILVFNSKGVDGRT
jgi:hypothetical protein